MTKYRLKLNHFYRLGYVTSSGLLGNAYTRYVDSDRAKQRVIEVLEEARAEYSSYTFWLEESPDNVTYTKLKEHNPYELFSEDIEEETPIIQPRPVEDIPF